METKKPNHELSPMRCPVHLEDVDLFSPGAAEHWYEAYEILHHEAPVHRIPGEGFLPGTDGFILSKYEDIALVVKEEERFPPAQTLIARQLLDQHIEPFDTPLVNAAMGGVLVLRPTPETWRAHRQELTDPWVGPGAGRNEEMIRRTADDLIDLWIEIITITPRYIRNSNIVKIQNENNEILGFGSIDSVNGNGVLEIHHLWVLPEYMDKNIGKLLLEHLESKAGDQKV